MTGEENETQLQGGRLHTCASGSEEPQLRFRDVRVVGFLAQLCHDREPGGSAC